MSNISNEMLHEFMNASFDDQPKARKMFAAIPGLLQARRMGESLLHFLAVEGHADVVDFLAKLGFDVNVTSELGNSPLVEVARLGNEKTVRVLLANGADPNAISDTLDTPLAQGLQSGNVAVVKMLLEAGAKLDYVTDIEETWRDHLPRREEKRSPILSLLAEYGAQL